MDKPGMSWRCPLSCAQLRSPCEGEQGWGWCPPRPLRGAVPTSFSQPLCQQEAGFFLSFSLEENSIVLFLVVTTWLLATTSFCSRLRRRAQGDDVCRTGSGTAGMFHVGAIGSAPSHRDEWMPTLAAADPHIHSSL